MKSLVGILIGTALLMFFQNVSGLSYVCKLQKFIGPCRKKFGRYYFNVEKGRCFKFLYGGCRGNGNNFKTRHECQSKCTKYLETNHKNYKRYLSRKRELITKGCKSAYDFCKLRPVGCYRDNRRKRSLPSLLASYRDPSSPVFYGLVLNWRKFHMSIERMVCDCAKRTKAKGYSHFGIQYFGECWSGPNAHLSYKEYGLSNACVNGKYYPCKKGELCSGKAHTNYVYSLVQRSPCKVDYKKVGCFHDPQGKHRPFPHLLDNFRDKTSHAYHGFTLSWKNYKKSLEIMICLCAQRAEIKGFKYFTIQFYGECWSGPQPKEVMKKSADCVNIDFKPCDPVNDCPCAGKAHINFVYERQ